MLPMQADSRELFRHVSADKSALYRSVMACFAAAKRQFRLHLRPDEVLSEAEWSGLPPPVEEIQLALAQLADWGNLEAQPDTARVANIGDFYRARFLYRLSHGGEAVETALAAFAQALRRRAELQTVALEDIANRLQTLLALADEAVPDAAKLHETLRDLVRVFESLADNAQAFMAGIGRSIEVQQADAMAVVVYKKRLIDYLERFIGDLVSRSGTIARHIVALRPRIDPLLWQAAQREARDAAPGDEPGQADAQGLAWQAWRERWKGLQRWFVISGFEPPQSELLRAKARSAIPPLLAAVAAVNVPNCVTTAISTGPAWLSATRLYRRTAPRHGASAQPITTPRWHAPRSPDGHCKAPKWKPPGMPIWPPPCARVGGP